MRAARFGELLELARRARKARPHDKADALARLDAALMAYAGRRRGFVMPSGVVTRELARARAAWDAELVHEGMPHQLDIAELRYPRSGPAGRLP